MPFVSARRLWQRVMECQLEHTAILRRTTEMVFANVHRVWMLVYRPLIIQSVLMTFVNVVRQVPVQFVLELKSVMQILARVGFEFTRHLYYQFQGFGTLVIGLPI